MLLLRFGASAALAALLASAARPDDGPSRALPDWAPPGATRLRRPADLPPHPDEVDPLVLRDGRRVKDAAGWPARRRQLLVLFQHYMYGYVPPLPEKTGIRVVLEDPGYLAGTATRKVVELRYGPDPAAALQLTLVVPNAAAGPAPCLFGLDLEEDLAAPAVERGYAFATFRKDDLAPDSPEFEDGVIRLYPQVRPRRGPHDWGALSAWAWGLGLAARHLSAEPGIDPSRLVVVGHSRKGKAALLAGALYESIALVVAHQSGAGGAAPILPPGSPGIETIADLLRVYPYWFADIFASFRDRTERLPVSSACLIALVAPRPVLVGSAPDERWANPPGQYTALKLADPVYRLLGVEGLREQETPREPGGLAMGRLGVYLRRQKGHFLTPDDWERFMDYADAMLGKPGRELVSEKKGGQP